VHGVVFDIFGLSRRRTDPLGQVRGDYSVK